jgi:hypothetical protein
MDETAIIKAIAGAGLTIDMVPDTCKISSVQDLLDPAKWNLIKTKTAAAALPLCRICGASGGTKPAECAEIWRFDENKLIITLAGFQTLCRACFRVRALTHGSDERKVKFAVFHLVKINGWSKELAQFYVNVCFRVWETRSMSEWKMELTYLRRNFKSVGEEKFQESRKSV